MYVHRTNSVKKSSFGDLFILALKDKLVSENINFNNE